jgi:tRNA A-37 threonylcarbamoyl transferase component Bud32
MNESSFKTGDRFGAYTIVRLIGRGRTAEVYEATREGLEKSVAVRCLRREHAASARFMRRMIEEASIFTDIRHTNVVAALDGGTHDGVPFSVLELVSGKTLRERLDAERGPLSMPIALCFVRQIADGAAALHAAGVVHGDLRPESIRLTDIDEVKLCDLGPGAPLKSPERGDPGADMRGVGLILAEMLVGRPVAAASLEEAIAPLPSYAQRLIEKAVAPEPGGGFASMTDLSDAINDAWNRLLQENRAGVELRRALDMLAGVIGAMGGAQGERKARSQDAAAGYEEEEDEDTDVDLRRPSLIEDEATIEEPAAEDLLQDGSNDLAALLKSVLDAARDLALEGSDEDEEPAAGSARAITERAGSESGE